MLPQGQGSPHLIPHFNPKGDGSVRVLAVGAHPDDIDAMVGGVLSRLASQNHDVFYLIATDGSKGTRDREDIPRLCAIRQAEQRKAAAEVGAKEVFFLNYVDGELPSSLAVRRDMVRVMRTVKADVVVAWDPTSYWIGDTVINHTDHRVSGQVALDAAYPAAGNVCMFAELGLESSPVREVWLYGSNHPNLFVDIRECFEQKLAAVRSHVSQHYLDDAYLYQLLRDDNAWVCRDFDNPVTQAYHKTPEYVETLRRITLDRLPDLDMVLRPSWELHPQQSKEDRR